MAKVIEVQTKLPARFGANDVAKFIHVTRLAVGGQSHHLAFVAVVRETDELCRGGIDDAGRVWVFNLVQHIDRVAIADGPHRRDKISEAVDRKQGGAIKGRYIKRTGEVRAMMFDVMKLSAQLRLRHTELLREIILQVAHLRRVAKTIFNLREYSGAAFLTISVRGSTIATGFVTGFGFPFTRSPFPLFPCFSRNRGNRLLPPAPASNLFRCS